MHSSVFFWPSLYFLTLCIVLCIAQKYTLYIVSEAPSLDQLLISNLLDLDTSIIRIFFWPSLYFLTSYQVLIQCINCACIAQKCVLYTSEVPLTSYSLVTSSLPPPSSLSSSSVCSILRVIWRKYIVYFQALDISISIKPKKRNLAMLLATFTLVTFTFQTLLDFPS